jgi:hypothetical protein
MPFDLRGSRLVPPSALAFLGAALVIGVGFAAFWRVHTYAPVSDPAYYLRLGTEIAGRTAQGERVGIFIAPLFPLLLAALRALGGPHAPYYANGVLTSAAWLFQAAALRRMGVGVGVAALTGPLALIALLGRDPEFAVFLYQPFREPLALALGALAAWAAAGGRWLGAGIALLLAGATREPFLALFLPFGLAAWRTGGERRERLRNTLGLLGPLLAAGLLIVLGWGFSGAGGQVRLYGARLAETGLQGTAFLSAGARLAHLLAVPGGLAIALGLWAWRGQPTALWLWGGGALALAGVQAPLRDHARHALVVIFFLAPLLTAGLAWPGRALKERVRTALSLATCAAVALLATQCVPRLRPWGPDIRVADVREFVRRAASFPADARWVLDARSRALQTLFEQFCPGRLLSPRQAIAAAGPVFFLRPLGEEPGARGPGAPDVEALLTHHADAVPGGAEWPLGPSRYLPLRLTAFQAGHRELPRPDGYGDAVLWIDTRAAGLPSGATLSLPETDWSQVLPAAGPGWLAIALAVPFTQTPHYDLAAATPLPADLRARWGRPGEAISFPLDARRSPSDRAWVPGRAGPTDGNGVALHAPLLLRLPARIDADSARWRLELLLASSAHPPADTQVLVDADGVPIVLQELPRPWRNQSRHRRRLAGEVPASAAEVTVRVDAPSALTAPLRLYEVRLAREP